MLENKKTAREIWDLTQNEVSKLGIEKKYKGYSYLISAIMLNVCRGMMNSSLYKEIYPSVADMNGVSPESVEKCIRDSLERTWKTSRNSYLMHCSSGSGKPTNNDVIAFISDRIRLERGIGF